MSNKNNFKLIVPSSNKSKPLTAGCAETKAYYIKKQINESIKEKSELTSKQLMKIEKFADKHCNSTIYVDIYSLLGDLFYTLGKPQKEVCYYTRAFERAMNLKLKSGNHKIVSKLVSSYIKDGKYEEAISLNSLILSEEKDIPKEEKWIIYYNTALAYNHLDDHENSLTYINKAKRISEKVKEIDLGKLLILEGQSLHKIGAHDKELNAYLSAFDIFNSYQNTLDLQGLVYINLVNLSLKTKELKEDGYLEHIQKIEKMIDEASDDQDIVSKLYIAIGDIYQKGLKKDIKAVRYYLKGLETAEKHNQTFLRSSLVNKIMDIYIKSGDLKGGLDLLDKYGEKVFSKLTLDKEALFLLKSILIYSSSKDTTAIDSLVSKILDKEERRINSEK
ncbi:tetratricopeptide repeat protein [Proteinivorax hydrogeniformans]|uniref:Tetratricopeptide repeat protein n=1 Tax=Proteinivorax hydrogeniformans TaxID=1826727 RepID=A0AAU8HTP3_9FIRM